MSDFVAPVRRIAIAGCDGYPYSNCVVNLGAAWHWAQRTGRPVAILNLPGANPGRVSVAGIVR
jgi:hypothetical protein